MELGLKDKVAAVTASSLGLGKAIALEFAKEGAKVAICARREGPLEETRAEIEAAGGEVLSCVADMTEREEIEGFIRNTADHFGRLDVLVNNAGDAAVGRTIEDPDEVWEQTYNINLWSAVRAARAAVPLLRQQDGSSIVNVASVSGHSGLGGMADYNSAKAAMLALTKTLAQDLAGDGVRVNAVNPALDPHAAVGASGRGELRRHGGRERRRGVREPGRPASHDPALRAAGRGVGSGRISRVGPGELRHRSLLERRWRLHEVPDLKLGGRRRVRGRPARCPTFPAPPRAPPPGARVGGGSVRIPRFRPPAPSGRSPRTGPQPRTRPARPRAAAPR